jgi:hypothetical protein
MRTTKSALSLALALLSQTASAAPKPEWGGWHCISESEAACKDAVCSRPDNKLSLYLSTQEKDLAVCDRIAASPSDFDARCQRDLPIRLRTTRSAIVAESADGSTHLRIGNDLAFSVMIAGDGKFIAAHGRCTSEPQRINVTNITP